MDPTLIYGLTAGGLFSVFFLYRVSSYISRWVQDRTLFYIFKYLIYPIFIQRSRLIRPYSRWHALLLTIYWLGTAACNIVGVSTVTQAGNRAGAISALHLIPLFFSNRLGFAADLLGISLQTYLRLHSSLGLMALLQGFIHVIIFFTHNVIHLRNPLQFYGFLVSIPSNSPYISTESLC